MNCLGCLILLLIFAGPTIVIFIFKLGASVVLGFLNKIGDTVIWLWESFLNYFRREKKEVLNPFNGESNLDDPKQERDVRYRPTEQRPKRYDSNDGEFIDYTDLK